VVSILAWRRWEFTKAESACIFHIPCLSVENLKADLFKAEPLFKAEN